jgi:photosystem II stability/assembly factor-like uncharacterized protein
LTKITIFRLIFIVFFLLFAISTAYPHQPHDTIDALEISPAFDMDGTLFAVLDSYILMRSSDGGLTWKWLTGGLDNKKAFTLIAASPNFSIDGTLFIGSEGDGIYRSQDRGGAWSKVNTGLTDLSIDLVSCSSDYAFDQIVLAVPGQGGMFKTGNGGQEWYSVIDAGIKITAIAFSPDIRNDARIFAGDDNGNLYYSIDKGDSWLQHPINFTTHPISAITPSPEFPHNKIIFVGTFGDGIFKSINSGNSFFRVNRGITDKSITSIAISPEYASDATIFATGADQAVFRSKNGGNFWIKFNSGIYYRKQGIIHYRSLKISNAFKADGIIFLGSFEGLFKSQNRGRSWLEIETYLTKTVTAIALSPEFMVDPAILISTYGGGAYRSDDNGITWNINNVGLERPVLYDIVVSPGYPSDKTTFTLQQGYVAKSTNGGEQWDLTEISDNNEVFPTVLSTSPDYMSDNTLYLGSRSHGVFKSTDGGIGWVNILGSSDHVSSIAVSPDHVSDDTLYIGIANQGIFKTMDRGDTWQSVNDGLTSLGNIKLAISPDYENDNVIFAGTGEGLFKTVDGGSNWEPASDNPIITDGVILGVAISPDYKNDKTVITSVHGFGLFKTIDGGVSWYETGLDLEDYILTEITFSPTYALDNTVLGASLAVLFRSTDSGSSWEIINRPVRYENTSDMVHYGEKWGVLKNDNLSAQSLTATDIAWKSCTFSFMGTGISWIGTKSPRQGIANVYLDGVFMNAVDQYHATAIFLEPLFTVQDLPYGPHRIQIHPTRNKNPRSSGKYTTIDAFDVF